MIRFTLSGVFKYLFGILLLQAATGLLVVAALRTDSREVWVLLGLFALILSILAALWFVSISTHTHKDTLNHMKEEFLREREKIRVRAEREKTRVIEKSHQRIIRDRNRTRGKSNMKLGAASLVGVLAVGGVMLFTQFLTIGMLLMTTAGAALAGYALRTRQEIGRKEKQSLGSKPPEKLIGSTPARRAIASLVGKRRELE